MAGKLGNLGSRVIVALIGIPVLVALCLFGKVPFLFFVLVVGLVSFHEFAGMLKHKNSYVNKLVGFPAVLLIIINEYQHFFEYQMFFVIVTLALLTT